MPMALARGVAEVSGVAAIKVNRGWSARDLLRRPAKRRRASNIALLELCYEWLAFYMLPRTFMAAVLGSP